MKKIASYILIMCLIGAYAYAGMSAVQETDTFAENALKEGSFPLTFTHSDSHQWKASGGMVQSTNHEDNSEGWFSTTIEVNFQTTVSFEWTVSSEYYYDGAMFHVDGEHISSIHSTDLNGAYKTVSHVLAPGVHTLRWSYHKNESGTDGLDEAKVRNIFISPDAFVVAGIGRPICDSQIYFGNVTVNTPVTHYLNLMNIGTEKLTINSVITEAPFSVGEYTTEIASLQKVTIPVTLTPTAEGSIEGKVVISTDYGTREVTLKAYCGTYSHQYAVPTPGALNITIPESEVLAVTALKLTGKINQTDIAFLKTSTTALKTLDLSEATLEGDTKTLWDNVFQSTTNIETLILPNSITRIGSSVFTGSTSLKQIVIPEKVEAIGNYTFGNCTAIENISLPSALRTLGSYAFQGCTSLKEMVIPEYVSSIEERTFDGCTALEKVVIGNGVKSISDYYTFNGCDNLTTIVIGDGVTKLESQLQGKTKLANITLGNGFRELHNAFNGCTALEKVTLPDSLRIIGNSTFSGCTLLTTVNIPDSVKTIGSSAFQGCENLDKIVFPKNLKNINSNAFYGCSSLDSIAFPDSVTYLDYQSFANCEKLRIVNMGTGINKMHEYYNTFANCPNIEKVYFSPQLTTIPPLFRGNTGLTTVILGDSTRIIDEHAFEGCTSLKDIKFPKTVKEIKFYAFNGCKSLQSITLPDSLETFGGNAFENCGLTSITIPNNIKELPSRVFGYCPNLEEVILGDSVKYTNVDHYYSPFYETSNIKTVTFGKGMQEIGDIFSGQTQLQKVILSDSVKTIGVNAFKNCSSLTDINIPNTATAILEEAFHWCTSLKNITLPDSLRILKGSSFMETGLTSITIPDKVSEIGGHAFAYCPDLTTVVLGDSVKFIESGQYAVFNESPNITSVTFGTGMEEINDVLRGKKKLTTVILGKNVKKIGENAFNGCTALESINLPNGITQLGAGAFANTGLRTLTLPTQVTKIAEQTFYNCDSLNSITLNKQLAEVAENAFAECDNVYEVTVDNTAPAIISVASGFASLKKISFGPSVTEIPDNLLSGKSKLEEISLGENVSKIGNSAFSATALRSFTFPAKVSTIGEKLFESCDKLKKVTFNSALTALPAGTFRHCQALDSIGLPASVKSIGSYAFDGCDSIRKIHLNAQLTEIAAYAFYNAGDKKLKSITIPAGVKNIGEYAFAECDTLSSITLGAGTDSIAQYAFQNCRNLKAITLPANTRVLGGNLFEGTAITSLVLPDKVASLKKETFNGLSAQLTSVTIGNGIKQLPQGVFSGFTLLKTAKLGTGLTKVPQNAFYDCTSLTNVTIGANVTELDAYSFAYCSALKNLTIPEKVTVIHPDAFYETSIGQFTLNMESIPDYAFNNRSDVSKFVLGEKVKSIGVQAFNNTNISEISLPAALATIKDRAFYGTKIKTVSIPASVTTIGENAFGGCNELTTVTIGAGSTRIGENAFAQNPALTTVTMQEGETATKVIAPRAFYFCNNLQNVTLAKTDSIGQYAFANCEKLAKIQIPTRVISENAFQNCTALTEVSFTEGLDSIRPYAFNGAPNIKALAFPNSLTYIGRYAFSYDDYNGGVSNKLENLTFGTGLKEIGERAFYDSPKLTRIELKENVEFIGRRAFNNCLNVRSIKVGKGIKTVQPGAFSGTNELLAIHWDSDTEIADDIFSPAKNCLMYVTAQTEVPTKWYNVVRNGIADSIDIADRYTYNCETPFKAKKIVFRKQFSLETGRGESKGWESIALPFNVSSVMFGSRKLTPFGADMTGATPFWLREMDAEKGFSSATSIVAHKPYIIAMPNNITYDNDYNVQGEVQFIAVAADGVDIPATPTVLEKSEGPVFDLVPTFATVPQSMEVYALNTDWQYTDDPETLGSRFERDKRDIRPFEVYVVNKPAQAASAPMMYSIGGNGDITGLDDMMQKEEQSLKVYSKYGIIYIHTDKDRTINIYDATGMLVRTVDAIEGENQVNGLADGIYFLEGKKVLVKK